MPADDKDELEQRVDDALRAAYRDGPEWMAVRSAVEALKADRRKCIAETPAETFERFTASIGRETEEIAGRIDAEVDRFAAATKGFIGDMRTALENNFRKK